MQTVVLPPDPLLPPLEAPMALRPRRQLSLIAFTLFVAFWIVSWFGLLGELAVSIGAQPITVRFPAVSNPQRLTVTYLTTVGDSDGDEKQFGFVIPQEEVMFPSADRATWRIAGHWIKTIHVTAPESLLRTVTSVDIQIGEASQTYRDLAQWKRIPHPFTGLPPDRSELAVTIELPPFKDASLPAINSVPLGTFVQRIFTFPIVALSVALLAGWVLVRFVRSPAGHTCWTTLNFGLNMAVNEHFENGGWPPRGPSTAWFLAGLALSAMGIGVLYARYIYPFTQDDNFSQFLPMVLYNCHALFSGHWPAWNPHQFLGAPVATMGIYSVTYPPLYLAYGLARLAGNQNWTIEIYTVLHLAAGYTILFALLRRTGVRPSLAALGSSSFVLSGWFLIAARSQMTFAPLAVWPVAMAWSLHHLATSRRANWRWILATALSIGLFFHAGHSQMWVYGMMFYAAGAGLYWLSGRLSWREVAQAVPALVIGIGIAAPLLILQAIEGTSSARSGAYGDRIDLLHMLLPLGNLLPRPIGLGSAGYQFFCEMYYSGTLFQSMSFFALALGAGRLGLTATTRKQFSDWLASNVWLVLFALAILFGLGGKGILWTAFAQLPIFDRFRWPIKFTYFCLLYSTLAGAILAERWLTLRPKLQYPMIAAVACLLLVHANLSRTSWYDFADRPYPAIPLVMQPAVNHPEGRLLTRWGSMDRSPLPGYHQSLPLDFATQAGAYAIGGYDTFLEGSLAARRVRYKFWTDPVAAARAYGVRWIAAERMLDHPVASANPFFSSLDAPSLGNVLAIHAAQDAGRLVGTEDGLTVHQIDRADPLAFVQGGQALPLVMNSTGVTIDTSSAHAGDTIICNIMMRNWMKAAVPLETDEWGRIRFRLEQPVDRLAISYSPPWPTTLLAGALLVLLGVLGTVGCRKLMLRHQHQNDSDRR